MSKYLGDISVVVEVSADFSKGSKDVLLGAIGTLDG